MSNATRLVAAVAGVGALLWMSGSRPTAEPRSADPVRDYTVSGPYTHDNLSIFLLHGPDTLPPRPVKTLDEALAAGTAVVHETGTVNTLCVENLSSDDDLMMQNGDILKGGKQDRVLQVAMILPPKSGRVAVPAFCVEAGRWTNRGGEAVGHFAANPGQIAGKALKNAVNTAGVQDEVWKNVAAQQAALSDKVGKPVNGAASPSSLQLAMEDKDLQAKLAGYRAALANTLDGKKWVVGYAIAVNGKVTGAEVFGSGVLLAKAWPKAVSAAAVEALSEKQDKAAFAAVTEDAVTAFLTDAGRDDAPPAAQGNVARTNYPLVYSTLDLGSSAPSANGQGQFGNLGGQFGISGGGIQGGSGIANPTLAGRSAATRSALVTGSGGQLPGASEWDDFPLQTRTPLGGTNTTAPVTQEQIAFFQGTNTLGKQIEVHRELAAPVPQSLPGLPVPPPMTALVVRAQPQQTDGNALQPLAGNQFNAWQVGHREDITVGNRPVAPIQAPPVRVNRTAGKNGVMVESRDRANPGVVIHRTFIAK